RYANIPQPLLPVGDGVQDVKVPLPVGAGFRVRADKVDMLSTSSPENKTENRDNSTAEELDLSPEIIENSPVLQRWLKEVPNVLDDIRNDPSFRTRLRLGYSHFPSTDGASDLMLVSKIYL
ncbi:MAG TPA: hypothetical protein V6C95_10615, partial [Coleofasciculaceae cyanobacterium]